MPDQGYSSTSTGLLEGLFDAQNRAAWGHFDERYRPILLGFARRLGLSADDAADVAQQTMVTFLGQYQAGQYDRTRGRLRNWLIGLARGRIAELKRARARRREGPGSIIGTLPDDAELEQTWEEERKLNLLRQAMRELRTQTKTSEKTLRAFEEYVLESKPAQDVARELEMSVRDVYMAKNRVAERIRAIVARLDSVFDDG